MLQVTEVGKQSVKEAGRQANTQLCFVLTSLPEREDDELNFPLERDTSRMLKNSCEPQAAQKGPDARRRRACRQAGGSEE